MLSVAPRRAALLYAPLEQGASAGQGGACLLTRLPAPPCRWERVHFQGNYPAARCEMGVAVSPKGVVYLAGA